MKCSVCKKELVIRLMPEFSSSGMWCNFCGVNFSNPKKTLPDIPAGLVDLIQGWNTLWDFTSCYFTELLHLQELLDSMGMELEKQLSVYCNCYYDKERSRIYPLRKTKQV